MEFIRCPSARQQGNQKGGVKHCMPIVVCRVFFLDYFALEPLRTELVQHCLQHDLEVTALQIQAMLHMAMEGNLWFNMHLHRVVWLIDKNLSIKKPFAISRKGLHLRFVPINY